MSRASSRVAPALARRARAATRDARGATTTTSGDDATRRRRRATTEARDDGQRRALDALERFYDGARLGTRAGRGVYLHGGVGRGKTALADATSEDAREKGGARGRANAFSRVHGEDTSSAARERDEGARRGRGGGGSAVDAGEKHGDEDAGNTCCAWTRWRSATWRTRW